MDNLDDEFRKLIQNSNLEDIIDEDGETHVAFTVQFLMESVAHVSRTLALLTELLQVVMEHHLSDELSDPPGLTREQLNALIILFDQSRQFNQYILDEQGEESD